jgi:hypothetical protein
VFEMFCINNLNLSFIHITLLTLKHFIIPIFFHILLFQSKNILTLTAFFPSFQFYIRYLTFRVITIFGTPVIVFCILKLLQNEHITKFLQKLQMNKYQR